MLKLATIIDNPGEPPVETRYRDPRVLGELGYNGVVIYESTGLSGVESPQVIKNSEMRSWATQRLDHVRQSIEAARAADLSVYLSYDVLVLARDVAEQFAGQVCCRGKKGHVICPASDEAMTRCLAALQTLLRQLPAVDGVVLRFGDNDAARLPYLLGNDIYSPTCPRCATLGRADRIERIITSFHQLVVQEMDKRLIVRAWNVQPGGLHDTLDLAQRMVGRLPGKASDDRLVLSFKFTQTDFWRYQQWNACSLVFGKRPILYELQCQREFEGKGAAPNWQAQLWRDGCPEMNGPSPQGLAQVSEKVNLAGLWAWVRGGGWGGPYVSNESWIDANVYCVPRLADDPQADVQALAQQWAQQRLGVQEAHDAAVIAQVLMRSAQTVLQGFYIGPYARQLSQAWHPNADWITDDLIDAEAAWRIVQRLPEESLDDVVNEKAQAVEQVRVDRTDIRNLVDDDNRRALEPLANTLLYAESLYATLRDLLAALTAYRRYKQSRDPAMAELCRQRIFDAQTHWTHHTQRYASLPGCATSFREANFWDLTQNLLTEIELNLRKVKAAGG